MEKLYIVVNDYSSKSCNKIFNFEFEMVFYDGIHFANEHLNK